MAAGVTASRMTAQMLQGSALMAPTGAHAAQRVGEPEDVAGAVLFLTSAAASFRNRAKRVPVDGDYWIVG